MTGPRIGELCAGYGGLGMGVQAVLGGELAWVSEYEPPSKSNPKPSQGAAKILAHRFPDVPNLGDMTAVDWSAVEPVDILTGGTPCQDLSAAGKRAGMRAGTRSGLWASMCDAIEIIRPGLVVWENVRGALSADADSAVEPCPICVGDTRDVHLRALGRVVGDLSEIGYVGRWVGLRASDVGAPHERFRVFVAAWPAADTLGGELQRRRVGGVLGGAAAAEQGEGDQRERAGHAAGDCGAVAADADVPGLEGRRAHAERGGERSAGSGRVVDWGRFAGAVERWERRLGRPAPAPTEDGRLSARFSEWMMGLPAGWVTDVPGLSRADQHRAIGNGVVPAQAAAALRMLLPDALEVAA